jgi:hypothetical protein
MKIILSRKGFDGTTGGFASPIMPCGRMLSLPIPVKERQMEEGEIGIPYENLRFDGQPLSEIIHQLSNGRFNYQQAHLDPDLDRGRFEPRRMDWKPAFGQVGQPQTLLKDVVDGDIFLFFGWFRRTRYENGQLRYLQPRKGGKQLHVIFGWLQVGQRFNSVTKNNCPSGLEDHLHVLNANGYGYGPTNTIYIAADELIVSGQRLGVRGAGSFPCFKPSQQLTAPNEKYRAHWSLPKWLCREQNHGNWVCCRDQVPFDSHSYGQKQEFVFDVPEPNNREAINWLKGLFEDCC